MRYIEATRLTTELEVKLGNIRSPLIQTGLTMALDAIEEAPTAELLSIPEVASEIRKAYQQGYLDGALQEHALGIK